MPPSNAPKPLKGESVNVNIVSHLLPQDDERLRARVGELADRHAHGMSQLKYRDRMGRPGQPTKSALIRAAVLELLETKTNEELEALLAKWSANGDR